jgi:hypothetical protein
MSELTRGYFSEARRIRVVVTRTGAYPATWSLFQPQDRLDFKRLEPLWLLHELLDAGWTAVY